MPKSKVRKKTEYTIGSVSRVPVKVRSNPSNRIYVSVLIGLLALGFLWIFLFYILNATNLAVAQEGGWLYWMNHLGQWNFAIGIGFIVLGLLMALGWH